METLIKLGVPAERVEVVLNRGDSIGGRITIKDLQELIKKPVFANIPNDYQFVAQSVDFGKPFAGNERNNPVRRAIRRMAKKIVTESAPDEPRSPQKRGLFGRLLAK
jgi:Flp pilus assembly CpaE family ATPase